MRGSERYAPAHLSPIQSIGVKSSEMGFERVVRRSLPSVAEEAHPEPVEGAGVGLTARAIAKSPDAVSFETLASLAPQEHGF